MLLLNANSSFAVISCFSVGTTSEDNVQESLNAYKTQCLEYGGGGSVWLGNYVKVKTCTGANGVVVKDTNGVWQVDVSCNTCTSEELKKEVSEFKESCASQCKTTDYQCSYTLGEWGGSMNALPKVCGATDSTLDGCRTEESSSSVEGSSGSGDEGSSSPAGGEGSSSSYGVDGSSSSGGSGEEDGLSSSGSGSSWIPSGSVESGAYGYSKLDCSGGYIHTFYQLDNTACLQVSSPPSTSEKFSSKPPLIGSYSDLNTEFSCYPRKKNGWTYSRIPYVAIITNIPYLYTVSETVSYCFATESDCENNVNYFAFKRGKYICEGGNSSEGGCSISSSVSAGSGNVCIAVDSTGRIGLGLNTSCFRGVDSVAWDLTAVGNDGYSALPNTGAYADYVLKAYADSIRSCFDDSEWDLSSSSSGTGGGDLSSGSESGGNNSSAAEIDASSSSNEGTFESEVFVAGENQVYSPDQVFCDGLQNMEFAKCYSLNPDRGIQHGWINDNAQDSWWWVEVPCDGSVPLIETTSAGCYENRRGPTAIYLPEDCFSGGLDNMEYGKCYALNPDRGAQYGWINNNVQDSWWWVEVPCEIETPDSDDEFVCPENGIFFKRNEPLETSEDSIELLDESVVGLYDALGRMQKHRNVFGKRNAFYARKAHRKGRLVREFFGNWSVSFKTVSGYVEAKTELGLKNVHFDCVSQTKTIIVANLYMKTPKDSIHKVIDSDDERLLAHENRHEEIYLLKGNGEWEERISVNSNRLTEKNSCYMVKKTFWPVMEKKYRKMLKMQNAWDDEDKNNVSHARLNIDSLLALQKKKWNAQPCLKENPE